MAVISIKGFFDTHIHTGPAPFIRIGDTADIARWCAAGGLGGIVIKSHFESTVSKAHHGQRAVAEEYPDFKVIAGIALNRGVGGINVGAVQIALEQGAKVVWLPTFDSANHVSVFGGAGRYGWKTMNLTTKGSTRPQGNFSVLENSRLSEDTKDVIDTVKAYEAVLATGHISRDEITAVVDYALGKNVKVLITHPEYTIPNLDVAAQVELAKAGCYLEYCVSNCLPIPNAVRIEDVKEMIEAVGPERAVIASDSGQPFNPRPPEGLRVFAQCLHEKGMDEKDIRKMAIDNPKALLGIA